jgi:hypothetical protein
MLRTGSNPELFRRQTQGEEKAKVRIMVSSRSIYGVVGGVFLLVVLISIIVQRCRRNRSVGSNGEHALLKENINLDECSRYDAI